MTDPAPAKKTATKRPAPPDPEKVHAAQSASPDGTGLSPAAQAILETAKWDALTADFPADWIEKLPRNLKKNDDNRGRCEEGSYYSADGFACHGYHARSIHLDYVGHAGITMRLNTVLGPAGWEFLPYAHDADGWPLITGREFFARLTIGGVTKWDMAENFNSRQEALGDALRRCAMRFGIGTYLWSKSEQALERARATDNPPPAPEAQRPPQGRESDHQAPPAAQDAEPAHIQKARAIISGLTQEERDNLIPWWDREAEAGNLPLRENLAALRPETVAWVEEVVAGIRDRLQNPVASDVGPQ